jgi:hypothetical protein
MVVLDGAAGASGCPRAIAPRGVQRSSSTSNPRTQVIGLAGTQRRPPRPERLRPARSRHSLRDPGRVTTLRVPSRSQLVTEAPRAGLDLAAPVATWPLLATARRGDGHPVLVLPGLLTGDPATLLMRSILRVLGHDVSGWSLGTNRGGTVRIVRELRSGVAELHRGGG